ncbi:G2 M phase-specific E3 ubiquitin- ligase-like [Paramuricea clavata]|uniref:G2 M phase-specific E3 ubiquitin- ligase-like n=1 Tax=Paramuricea clavata TaxID=317549 RepID=A0A6S7K7B1_PARCT|nr:G2 M phase-specific E3 ubiquitin- ligase-like [Paramuricea clavata]
MYKLLYGNIAQVQEAKIIPGSKEAFSLKRYKEEIGKPYSKISFYICPLTDFLEDFVNSSSSSDEQMCDNSASDGTQEQNQSSSVEELTVISPNPTIPTQSKTVQCPFCLNHFSVQEVQHHVEQCSEWLLNEDHEVLEVNNSDNEQTVAESQVKISDMGKNEIKEMLKDEVAQVSKLDLQQEGKKKGDSQTKIKVVFSGEPAVDDGGPRRELFSDLLSIIKRRYFHDGSPVKSTIAISNGDFKLCGIIMGMSIKQGGPAPNFMTHAVSCFFTGCEMLTSDVRSSAYQDIVTCLSNATTDEQVIGILTKDSSLDILQELGYTSVPHMETIATAKRIVQSLCMKDQIGDVLAELMEIKNGLEACGISSDTIKKRAELWQIMFKSGSFFSLPAEEFLDELIVVFSESQIRKNAEIDVYKFFCDAMLSIENGCKYKLHE